MTVLMKQLVIPTREEFVTGVRRYEESKAGASYMASYKVAAFYLREHWGQPAEMVRALTVFPHIWLRQVYAPASSFGSAKLKAAIAKHMPQLQSFRDRDIFSFNRRADAGPIEKLFNDFLDALPKGLGKRSPVAVGEGLHLLAPAFFPMWDRKIARDFGCHFASGRGPAAQYVLFCGETLKLANRIKHYLPVRTDLTAVKMIDMYLWQPSKER